MKILKNDLPHFGFLKLKVCFMGPEVFWADNETHHAELIDRFLECGVASRKEAAVLATIQTGYWPNWLVIRDEGLEKALKNHYEEISSFEGFGTSSFGGYFEDNWPAYEAGEWWG